jgi:catechol 2,3-dioxygenase-like lactoylglutathione lyase family enzyme
MSDDAVAPIARAERPITAGTTIGHVHLRTADIDRVRGFYVDVLGFDVISELRDIPGWGTTGDALFLSAGGYHHHLGFNTWKSAGPAAAGRCHRPAPRRDPLSDPRRPGRRRPPAPGRRLAAAPTRREAEGR